MTLATTTLTFGLIMSLLYLISHNTRDVTTWTTASKARIPLDPDQWPKEFDFIIVGAGTAGSIVASRLAETPEWNILLVEAGGEPLNISYLPEYRGQLYQSVMDWNFSTEQQSGMFLSLQNQRSRIALGKGMGGSSSIHSLFYTRGDERDYEEWGHEAFKFENLLPHFKKSEFMSDSAKRNAYHGTQGPFVIKPSPHVDNTFDTIGKVCQDRYGLNPVSDINTGKTLGSTHYDLYMDSDGLRVSSYTAYIRNRNKRNHHNLYVLKNSHAVRLLVKEAETPKVTTKPPKFESKSGRENLKRPNSGDSMDHFSVSEGNMDEGQSGTINLNKQEYIVLNNDEQVQYLSSDAHSDIDTIVEKKLKISSVEIRIGNVTSEKIFCPKVSKEIILSAGAINTPKLLMNSGVGPTAELLSKDIRQVKSLSVGENFWDHVHFNGLLFRTNDERVVSQAKYGGGAGILMSLLDNPARPNVEYQVQTFNKNSLVTSVIPELHNYQVETQLGAVLTNSSVVRITPALVRPKSKGRISLGENPIQDPPLIQGNYLKDPEDVFVMIDSILKIEELQSTPEFKKNGMTPIILNFSPSCNASLHSSNAPLYWLCALSHLASSNWHPMGSCRLGEVVDETLLVNGFDNLRIADASVIPVMSAHPNAAVAVLAEYVSSLITSQHNVASLSQGSLVLLIVVAVLFGREYKGTLIL